MSIIISKPGGSIVEEKHLRNFFARSSDGIGFCYSENNVLVVKKGFKTFEGFYEKYLTIEKLDCLIHFAEKDSPICSKKFCGPFKLDENHALIHVGDIWKTEYLANSEESQTANLVKFLKNIWQPILFGKNYLKWMIEEGFDSKNLIAIMDNEGRVQLFNENKGVTIGKIWYSETPYKQFNPPIPPGQNRYNYNYPYQQDLPICNKCRFRCQGGSVSRNGIIYCVRCNEEANKIIQHKFSGPPASEVRVKLNEFLKDILAEPESIDCMDLF